MASEAETQPPVGTSCADTHNSSTKSLRFAEGDEDSRGGVYQRRRPSPRRTGSLSSSSGATGRRRSEHSVAAGGEEDLQQQSGEASSSTLQRQDTSPALRNPMLRESSWATVKQKLLKKSRPDPQQELAAMRTRMAELVAQNAMLEEKLQDSEARKAHLSRNKSDVGQTLSETRQKLSLSENRINDYRKKIRELEMEIETLKNAQPPPPPPEIDWSETDASSKLLDILMMQKTAMEGDEKTIKELRASKESLEKRVEELERKLVEDVQRVDREHAEKHLDRDHTFARIRLEMEELKKQSVQLRADNKEYHAINDQLREQLAAVQSQMATYRTQNLTENKKLQERIAQLVQKVQDKEAEVERLRKRYDGMHARRGSLGEVAIPGVLERKQSEAGGRKASISPDHRREPSGGNPREEGRRASRKTPPPMVTAEQHIRSDSHTSTSSCQEGTEESRGSEASAPSAAAANPSASSSKEKQLADLYANPPSLSSTTLVGHRRKRRKGRSSSQPPAPANGKASTTDTTDSPGPRFASPGRVGVEKYLEFERPRLGDGSGLAVGGKLGSEDGDGPTDLAPVIPPRTRSQRSPSKQRDTSPYKLPVISQGHGRHKQSGNAAANGVRERRGAPLADIPQ